MTNNRKPRSFSKEEIALLHASRKLRNEIIKEYRQTLSINDLPAHSRSIYSINHTDVFNKVIRRYIKRKDYFQTEMLWNFFL